jgi:hypothetical protein
MDEIPEEEDRNLVLRVIKYVKQHHRVTAMQISTALNLDEIDKHYLFTSLLKAFSQPENPNHILVYVDRPVTNTSGDYKEDQYQLLPTALFSYVDYLEIKEARKAADRAHRLSLRAIKISVWSLIGAIAIIIEAVC